MIVKREHVYWYQIQYLQQTNAQMHSFINLGP